VGFVEFVAGSIGLPSAVAKGGLFVVAMMGVSYVV
jgi:hypothetical protein